VGVIVTRALEQNDLERPQEMTTLGSGAARVKRTLVVQQQHLLNTYTRVCVYSFVGTGVDGNSIGWLAKLQVPV
jgi:hypothetical protein